VVAADRPPADLESLDERVRSRLGGGLVVESAPSTSSCGSRSSPTRLAAMKSLHQNFEVSPTVTAYVARAITANGRDLEGAVNRSLPMRR
jgi:chromosomal replication initiator protein